ncbi:unnamed protein product, partial [Medioppia subpectinata]
DFDVKESVNTYKTIIDLNAKNITAAEEQELIQLAKEANELHCLTFLVSNNGFVKQLSDRVIDTLVDYMATMFTKDYVQKILMTGEMSDQNMRFGWIFAKRTKAIYRARIELVRLCLTLARDDKTRQLLKAMDSVFASKGALFYQNFEQQLGAVGGDVKGRAMDKTDIGYHLMIYREMKRGSLVRMILLNMVPDWRALHVWEYLKSQPQYRPSPLSDKLLQLDLDVKESVNTYKTIIDLNAKNITAAEEQELIQLAKEANELHCKFTCGAD